LPIPLARRIIDRKTSNCPGFSTFSTSNPTPLYFYLMSQSQQSINLKDMATKSKATVEKSQSGSARIRPVSRSHSGSDTDSKGSGRGSGGGGGSGSGSGSGSAKGSSGGGKGGKVDKVGKGGKGGKGGGPYVKALAPFTQWAQENNIRPSKGGATPQNPPIAEMLGYKGPLTLKQLERLPPSTIRTTVPFHLKLTNKYEAAYVDTAPLLEDVFQVSLEQLLEQAESCIGGSAGAAAIELFKNGPFFRGKMPSILTTATSLLLGTQPHSPYGKQLENLSRYIDEKLNSSQYQARAEEERELHVYNTLATAFNVNRNNFATTINKSSAYARTMALNTVLTTLDAAHGGGWPQVLLPEEFYLHCLNFVHEEAEGEWKGSGEPAVAFLKERGAGLANGFMKAILSDPNEGDDQRTNPLVYLYLSAIVLTNSGRQFVRAEAECFRQPEGGGLATWLESEHGTHRDPAMHNCPDPASLPPLGVFFMALLCQIHWIRLRERNGGKKVEHKFSAESFPKLRSLWVAAAKWYKCLTEEITWSDMTCLEDFGLRPLGGDDKDRVTMDAAKAAFMSPPQKIRPKGGK
jgi:hypothetical protein